jgi:hypothetical protein
MNIAGLAEFVLGNSMFSHICTGICQDSLREAHIE